MNIDHSSYTNAGGRPINEDSLYCRSDCFVVADGLGGHENGETASAQAVKYISENYSGSLDDDTLSNLLTGADEAVRSGGDGGKSTLAALFFSGDKVRYSNVGDSRVYYFRQGRILSRTKDHSVCQAAVELGELSPDEVRSNDDRSGLFKVLGASNPLKVPKPYEPVTVQDGDAFLLCSDGFWEYVYEIEMEADLLKSASAADWLRHMVKRLLLRSGNSGDNYTAVCGIIHAPEKKAVSVNRKIVSPVLIACLAFSLAALGTMAAIKLLAPGSPVDPPSSQPELITSQSEEGSTKQAHGTAEQTAEAPAETSQTGSTESSAAETSEPASEAIAGTKPSTSVDQPNSEPETESKTTTPPDEPSSKPETESKPDAVTEEISSEPETSSEPDAAPDEPNPEPETESKPEPDESSDTSVPPMTSGENPAISSVGEEELPDTSSNEVI